MRTIIVQVLQVPALTPHPFLARHAADFFAVPSVFPTDAAMSWCVGMRAAFYLFRHAEREAAVDALKYKGAPAPTSEEIKDKVKVRRYLYTGLCSCSCSEQDGDGAGILVRH